VPVFESPKLGEKAHTLGMVVIGAAAGSHHGYVNIDEIEVLRTR
jgi:hypothetical protein